MSATANFSAHGRTGAQIETDINEYAQKIRKSLREWEAQFDGPACVRNGKIYVLQNGADATADPATNTGDWNEFSIDSQYKTGSLATLKLSTTVEPVFVVTGETTNESLNGIYVLASGSYHKID